MCCAIAHIVLPHAVYQVLSSPDLDWPCAPMHTTITAGPRTLVSRCLFLCTRNLGQKARCVSICSSACAQVHIHQTCERSTQLVVSDAHIRSDQLAGPMAFRDSGLRGQMSIVGLLVPIC